jgi:hypothetical protein
MKDRNITDEKERAMALLAQVDKLEALIAEMMNNTSRFKDRSFDGLIAGRIKSMTFYVDHLRGMIKGHMEWLANG